MLIILIEINIQLKLILIMESMCHLFSMILLKELNAYSQLRIESLERWIHKSLEIMQVLILIIKIGPRKCKIRNLLNINLMKWMWISNKKLKSIKML